MTMLKIIAVGGALALSVAVSGCSSMMGGDASSASNVSKDSAGAGALPQATSMPTAPAAVGTSGVKNP